MKKAYKPPTKSTPNCITKCPYCKSEYHHNKVGPQVIVYQIKNPDWSPTLTSKIHDARSELRCDYCGAQIKLNVEIPKYHN